MIGVNSKHPNYDDQLLPSNDDVFKPEFKRDSRGRYFMQLPGYGKWMVGNEPGSKIIAQGSEDERGGPGTDPGSMRTGSLHAETVISIGDNIYLDGGTGCIYVGDYQKRVQPSIDICGEGIKGHVGTDTVFAFFLEKDGDFGIGDFFIGDYGSDNYVLWDDSEGYLYVKGKIYATSGEIGGWDIGTCLKKEYTISTPSKTKIELCAGNPGHIQAAYSPAGSFSLPGDVYMVQITQGSTADAGGVPIPRLDIYNNGTKRAMLNSDGLYFFDADGTTINNKIELTQATLHDVLLESGALATNSEPSIQGWSHDITFSSTDYNTVAWDGTKQIKLTNEDTFTITAGNTGNMSVITYIYLDKGTSETVLQTTTTASTAIGSGKILIAVAKNNADASSDATFQVFGGKGGALWVKDNIAANTITANEIHSNTITTTELVFTPYVIGTNDLDDIGNGTTYGKILNTSISAGKITLSAAVGDLDDISNGTYGKVLTTDISSGHILLSAATGTLDNISNGTTYSKVATTSISAGKIVLTSGTGVSGSLPTGYSDAKCIDANADQTSTHTANNASNYTGNAISTSYTNAKCTDANADQTSTHTSADTSAVNGLASSSVSGWAMPGHTTYINGGDIYTSTITAAKINVTNLAALSANCGSIRVGGSGNTYGTLSVRDSAGTEVALLNNNAIIVRQNKAFSAESSSSGTYTQFYTSGLNGIIEITNNASGTFGIKDDDSSHYFMKWSNYDIQSFKTILPDVSGSKDLGSTSLKWDDIYCYTLKGPQGQIWLDQTGRVQVTNHFDPTGTAVYNLGGNSRYWNEVHYHSLQSHSLMYYDDEIELLSGEKVSCIEAIQRIKKSEKKMSKSTLVYLDKKSFPKDIYSEAKIATEDIYENEKIVKTNGVKTIKKILRYKKGEKIGTDSINETLLTSLMLSALKNIDNRLKKLETN